MKVAKSTKQAVEGEREKTMLKRAAEHGGMCEEFSEGPFSPCPPQEQLQEPYKVSLLRTP